MSKPKIAIIGGGSSGLFLANLLKDINADVYIIEKNNKLGKKILASGNGKCNFTNIYDLKDKYNNTFANTIIGKYTVKDTLMLFEKNGLIYKNDDMGRCYPVSECSSSVLDCLKKGLNKSHILLDTEVRNISSMNNKYVVEYKKGNDIFDYIVCCSGSCASNLGSEKAYNYLNSLKIKISDLRASLTPIIVKEDISLLKGVRVKCKLEVFGSNNMELYKEEGEVLFKEDALSGIAVFNASSIINRKKDDYKIVLDLSSGMNKNQLYKYVRNNIKDSYNMFKGFLNDKLGEYIFLRSKVDKYNLKDKDIDKIVETIGCLSFKVKDLYSLNDAQVCSGGVELSQLNQNLEMKKYPNMYIAGELLDIDGISGGYNLQFAWSSAGVIAKNIMCKIGKGECNEKE